jgi:hypothetical protein
MTIFCKLFVDLPATSKSKAAWVQKCQSSHKPYQASSIKKTVIRDDGSIIPNAQYDQPTSMLARGCYIPPSNPTLGTSKSEQQTVRREILKIFMQICRNGLQATLPCNASSTNAMNCISSTTGLSQA